MAVSHKYPSLYFYHLIPLASNFYYYFFFDPLHVYTCVLNFPNIKFLELCFVINFYHYCIVGRKHGLNHSFFIFLEVFLQPVCR